ncbi:MAG TPA: hypothetical protein PKC59_03370 [Burkholderiaceae bacterium]|nr:hypothetical protein [Burkholderiaceae bacterium]HMY98800.1 hypothetical protein [Burkholderiaceae bacterium]HNB43704.1 hypothetical protein [Burkholderiaceae bacterium]
MKRLDAIIVAVGQFNPAILSPSWLQRKDLISESDADSAMESLQALVTEGLMSFDTSWFSLRLVQQQLVLSTTAGATPRIRDLAASIFRLLPETPVTAIGINFAADVQFDSVAEYHQFGDVLVPKEVWSKLYPGLSVGVASLQLAIDSTPRTHVGATGSIQEQRRFTIQPSNVIHTNAVHIAYNHHYPLGDDGGGRAAMDLIMAKWEADFDEVENKFELLLKLLVE